MTCAVEPNLEPPAVTRYERCDGCGKWSLDLRSIGEDMDGITIDPDDSNPPPSQWHCEECREWRVKR
jgi:hypothetical protein